MNNIFQRKYSQKKKDILTLPSLKLIISKYYAEYLQASPVPTINSNIKEIIHDILKVKQFYKSLYKIKRVKKLVDIKYKKFIELVKSKKQLKIKQNKDKEKIVNISICCISIIILKYNYDQNKHNNIKEHIIMLLILVMNDILNFDNFIFIINIILVSIIDLLSELNISNLGKYSLKKEPLLFINDIIEAIIDCPFDIRNASKFIEEIFKLFNNFFELAKNQNIFIEKDELWLKLFENRKIKNIEIIEESESCTKEQIYNFLIDMYKNNIPKKFYDEIYKISSFDLNYYFHIIKFLQTLFQLDNDFNSNIGFNIKNGIIFYGNTLFYKNINIKSDTNEFSLIFSFKINEIRNDEEIIIFNLNQIEKNSMVKIIIDNQNNLNIEFIKNSKWNTNILIEKNKDYIVCLTFSNSSKLAKIYINTDKVSNSNIKNDKLNSTFFCCKYTSKKMKPQNFSENMFIQLGNKNLYGILGDIVFINKEIEDKDIIQLFNSIDYYGDLIYGKNLNNNLLKNYTIISKGCKAAINHFKNIKYECIFRIIPNSFIVNFNENNIYEYKNTNSFNIFIKEKGIEYLIFMLHNINSQSNDNKTFNFYLYKTLDFLFHINIFFQTIINKIFEDEIGKYCSYLELNEEEFIKQINLFFLSLLSILNENKKRKNYKLLLCDDIRKCLKQYLEINFENSIFHKNIIISILLDNELFNQKKYFRELNDLLSNKLNVSSINKEIIYKLLLLDDILENKKIKHKLYCTFLGEMFNTTNDKYFFNVLVNYITKIQSEIKIYHYLKIIYYNIDKFKTLLEKAETDQQFNFFRFIEVNFESLKKEHCKYCSYIIVLCFLIKEKVWNDKAEYFTYNTFGFMISPSFMFIRSVFIESFDLTNIQKFQFIKIKSDIPYNMDFFNFINKNPIELCSVKLFFSKFNSLVKYLNFLYNIEKKDENLKDIISCFFLFIIELFEKIRTKKYLSENIQKQANHFLKDFFSSKDVGSFFVLYFKYNKEKAMKSLINHIKSPLGKITNSYIFYLIYPETVFGNKKISMSIKIEIMKNFILEIINRKKDCLNIYSLLVLIDRNIYEEKIEQLMDFPMVFFSFYIFISNIDLFLLRKPLDLNYFYNKRKNFIYEIKEKKKNTIKFVSEIIIDIIFKFFIEENQYNPLMIRQFLIKESSSTIFYLNDDEHIKMKKGNSFHESKSRIFKTEFKYFLFSLYYLIIFLNKLRQYPNCNKEKKSLIDNLCEMLFNDLIKIYRTNKKITNVLKPVENYGSNFHLYNKMLQFCNKNYKDSKFCLKTFIEKYDSIINSNKNKEFEIFQHIGIEGINEINFENISNPQKYKKERSKSFDKTLTDIMKEKYLENPRQASISFPAFTFDEDFLNRTMLINLNINLNEEKMVSTSYRTASCAEINVNTKKEGEIYLKNKLAKKNIIYSYYKQIINYLDSLYIKMLFNPKEYFIWKNFTLSFKDLLFNNKKFKKISILFKIYTRKKNVIYSHERDKEFYLNYPSKIKNYIIDDYYRPFVKPNLNFFKHKYINKSHPYIKKDILFNAQYIEENFYSIHFCRTLPNLPKKKRDKKIKCEILKNKGNVFGYILFFKEFLVFFNSPEEDERNSNDLRKRMKFIYSIREDITVDTNKYIIIYYKDIKEVIKRRVCFNYIGYEFFLKDDRSYFFNFFEIENIKEVYIFLDKLKNTEKEKIKLSKKNSAIIEENKKSNEKKIFSSNNANLNTDYNFKIIEEPSNYVEKLHLKDKYKKGEISNFNYLLLLNKFSSRSFNDYNQYLIFPLLFLDISRKVLRDFSKPVSLNKENNKDILNKCISNRESEGYHFNQHYSTGGFVLYYLLRLVPFTYSLIEFQSGKFDLPARLFSSMNNYLIYFTLTQDNRELCPEFFFNYEFLLNLNYNDFGEMEIKKQNYYLNNFDTNFNETFVQFIIYLRNLLEKSDISPWIDNIFGVKQINFSDEQPNSFPFSTYEQYCQFEKIKKEDKPLDKKIEEIQEKIDILKFGITPAKIFNKPHKKNHKQSIEFEDEINNFEKKESKILEIINAYIEKKSKEKETFYLIKNNNTNEIELIFKYTTRIDIFKLKIKEVKCTEESFNIKDQIDMEPYNNSFCKIYPGLWCAVRNKDKTIKFITKKDTKVYKWACIVTAIEPLIEKEKSDENNIKKVFLGDENGYLHIMEIEYDSQQNDKHFFVKSIQISQSIKAHNSLIRGIIYSEKLNIVISWSDEGVISINNDYSLNFLNIIDLGTNLEIKEILLSKYDILIINAINKENDYSKIISLTLSGIRISLNENPEKIVGFYTDEKVCLALSNGNIFSHECYDLYNLGDNTFSEYIYNYEEVNVISLNIKYCMYYPKIKKLLLIYTDNKSSFQKLKDDFV